MINIYEYVKQLNVENGSSQRMTCPMCKSYKTFTVQTTWVLYFGIVTKHLVM